MSNDEITTQPESKKFVFPLRNKMAGELRVNQLAAIVIIDARRHDTYIAVGRNHLCPSSGKLNGCCQQTPRFGSTVAAETPPDENRLVKRKLMAGGILSFQTHLGGSQRRGHR
ncbi:hypothetical protein TNCV_3386911 [Trichonephila clavipes]|nr:hypothetical protein TNCV_3386911 [Trichonephila clavipes]